MNVYVPGQRLFIQAEVPIGPEPPRTKMLYGGNPPVTSTPAEQLHGAFEEQQFVLQTGSNETESGPCAIAFDIIITKNDIMKARFLNTLFS